jgi:hypothetical protein
MFRSALIAAQAAFMIAKAKEWLVAIYFIVLSNCYFLAIFLCALSYTISKRVWSTRRKWKRVNALNFPQLPTLHMQSSQFHPHYEVISSIVIT